MKMILKNYKGQCSTFTKYCLVFFIFVSSTKESIAQINGNEKLFYDVSYKIGGLSSGLGKLTISNEGFINQHIGITKGDLQFVTYKKWDYFFKVRCSNSSYYNTTTFKPVVFFSQTSLQNERRSVFSIFQPDKKTVKSSFRLQNKFSHSESKFYSNQPLDIVAVFTQFRMLRFNDVSVGEVFDLSFLFDNHFYTSKVKYLGNDNLSVLNQGAVQCIKVAISIDSADEIEKSKNYVWITNDARRLPVKFVYQMPLGFVEVLLIKFIH